MSELVSRATLLQSAKQWPWHSADKYAVVMLDMNCPWMPAGHKGSFKRKGETKFHGRQENSVAREYRAHENWHEAWLYLANMYHAVDGSS